MGFLKKVERAASFVFSPPFVLTFVFNFFMTCTVVYMYQTVSAGVAHDKKQKECAANQSMVVYKEHVFWVEKPSACNISGSVEEVETSTSNKCLPF